MCQKKWFGFFALICLPLSVSADLRSIENFISSCDKPSWLIAETTNFDESLLLRFPDAINDANTQELSLSRSHAASLRVEASIPRPDNNESKPDYFFIMISTPSGLTHRESVAQLQNHNALRRRLSINFDDQKSEEFKRNYNLAAVHISEGVIQHFKQGVDLQNGNTPYIKSFWRTATDTSYDQIIDPTYVAHTRGNENVELYDHLIGYKSLPEDDIQYYHYETGHKTELYKTLSDNGRAFAFILDPNGECMHWNEVRITD
jgi:hypothetical protein